MQLDCQVYLVKQLDKELHYHVPIDDAIVSEYILSLIHI